MRHAPLVIAATIAGLAGVLSFHTGTAKITLGALRRWPRLPAQRRPPSVPAKKSGPSTGPSAARTAVGAAVNYNYGILSVSATVSGTKLTNVAIASINDGGNFRSQSIDQQSIPHARTTGSPGPERQHPGSVRGELHQRRVPTVFAVGAHQAGVQVMPVLPPELGSEHR